MPLAVRLLWESRLVCASYSDFPGSFPHPEDLFTQNISRLIRNSEMARCKGGKISRCTTSENSGGILATSKREFTAGLRRSPPEQQQLLRSYRFSIGLSKKNSARSEP